MVRADCRGLSSGLNLTWRLDNSELIVERSAVRDPSRQRNVANQSGFNSLVEAAQLVLAQSPFRATQAHADRPSLEMKNGFDKAEVGDFLPDPDNRDRCRRAAIAPTAAAFIGYCSRQCEKNNTQRLIPQPPGQP